MAKRWNRTETWVGLIVLGIGGVILVVAGIWIYVSATTKPIHPNVADVPSVPQSPPAEKWAPAVQRSRDIVRAGVAEQNLPGVSVAAGIGGELVWAEGFGWADIDKKAPVTPNTKFRLGTASIPLTSVAAALLMEQGTLNFDERIHTYVPEFPEKPWPVTLRQIMGHTAGIRSDSGDEGPLFGKHCDRPVEALSEFAGSDLRFEPGTQYNYSRYGFILVSAAIESAGGSPLLAFMQKHVFDPLGMNETIPDSLEASPDRATPYFPRFAADPRYGPDVMRDLDLSCYAGGGMFLSTPSDLVRFVHGVNGGKLLKPETVQMLQASQRLASGEETNYGLGWDRETIDLSGRQVTAIGHDGDVLGGIAGSLMAVPDRGIVIAILSNTSYADTPALAQRLAQAFSELLVYNDRRDTSPFTPNELLGRSFVAKYTRLFSF